MAVETGEMSTDEAREHLARLDVTQDGFAALIRVNPATFRRWLNPSSGYPMPRSVQLLLRKLTPADVRRMIDADEAR